MIVSVLMDKVELAEIVFVLIFVELFELVLMLMFVLVLAFVLEDEYGDTSILKVVALLIHAYPLIVCIKTKYVTIHFIKK